MFQGLFVVFSKKRYVLAALTITTLVFLAITLAPNSSFIRVVLESSSMTLGSKISLIGALLTSSFSVFPFFSTTTALLTAILFSVNISMSIFVFRRQVERVRGHGTMGIAGLLSALLGIGCASCGPLLIAGLLPFLGLGSFLPLLPFKGHEFEILGILILIFSVTLLSKEAVKPAVCEVK